MEQPTRRSALVAAAGITALAAVVLWLMGQSWWCSCGRPVPWSWDIWSTHNSQHLIDPYFFSHVLHGVIFFAALRWLPSQVSSQTRFIIAVTIEAGWELLENSPLIIERYRAATISLDYYGDAIANSLFDIIACVIGYLLTASVRWWWSLALVAAVELAMLITIRDSLALNVIMLVHPIDAIKEWQMP